MWSSEHAAAGGVVSAVLVALLGWPASSVGKLLLWAYGLVLSVFIDLDHFVIARIRVGDWSHLRDAVSDPVGAFVDQGSVFPQMEFSVQRLLSHLIVGGGLTLLSALAAPLLAVFTAVVVYVHVVADQIRDAELA